MRTFENFDWSDTPDGKLVLMTVSELGDPKVKMSIADFRDIQALFLPKFGRWIGMSPSKGLRFGTGPTTMVDGVWYCIEDMALQENDKDIKLSPELMTLEMIG